MNIQEAVRRSSEWMESSGVNRSPKPIPLSMPGENEAGPSDWKERQVSVIAGASGPSWVGSAAAIAKLLELDCPEEHRPELMRLLASCQDSEAVINQLSRLYLLDDEWPTAFDLLFRLNPVEIEVVLNRANQLNLTSKLKALALLVPMDDADRAIAVYEANNLAVPDCHRLQVLEIFSQNQDPYLSDLVNQLPVTDRDRLEGMRLLLCLPAKRREAFCWWFAHLCQGIDRDETLPILKRFLFASDHRFEWILTGMDELCSRFDLRNVNPLRLLEIMEPIDEDGLSGFLEVGDSFIGSSMDEQEKMAVLVSLSKMTGRQWGLSDRLLKFWMTTEEKIFLLQACSSVPEESFDFVVKEGNRLIDFISHWKIENLAKLIAKIALVPDCCRDLFHSMEKEERLALLKTIPHAPEIVRTAWWHASEKDRKEISYLNEKHLQYAFIQMTPEEKEEYGRMHVREREDYLLCPEERRDLFLQEAQERWKVRRSRIDAVSRAMRKEELDLNHRMHQQSSSAEWHADNKLWVNALEMIEHPHRVLLDYLSKKECVAGYPKIGYLTPEGEKGEFIDNWGLTRDFIGALFRNLSHPEQKRLPMIRDPANGKCIPRIWHPSHLSHEEKLEMHPSEFAVLSEDLQNWCYLTIGLLFRVALNSRSSPSQPVVVGPYFDECALKMIYACDHRDDGGPKRLQTIYLRERYPQFFDGIDGRDMYLLLHENKISPEMEKRGMDEDSWHELERTSLGVAQAVIQISKGIQMPSRLWISAIPYDVFKGQIEGKFSREQMLKAFGFTPEKNDWNRQEIDLMRWIRQADIRDVEKLAIAICGSGAMAENQRFQLAVDDSLDPGGLPRFSTCSQMMCIPPYPNYAVLEARIAEVLKKLDESAAAGARFQGIV